MEDTLLTLLKRKQSVKGYLSENDIKELSIETNIPVSRIYGVVTFYSMLHTSKQGRHSISLCRGPGCCLNGSEKLFEKIKKECGIEPGQTTPDGSITLHECSCIGCCDQAPVALLDGEPITGLTEEKMEEVIERCRHSEEQN